MDHSAPAAAPAGNNEGSPVHSSPRSNIDSLIESVHARSMTSTNIRLGNKLAKPSTVEQSPSSVFTFATIKPAIPANHSTQEKGRVQGEENVKLSAHPDVNQRIPSSKTVLCCPEKILNFSELQEIPDTSLNGSVSTIKQIPPQSIALTERKSPDSIVTLNDEQTKVPARVHTLRTSSSSVNTPTLMKILAFTYHQETKQQNELISNLRSEYAYKIQELSAAEAHCQALEQSIEELHDQANVLKTEVDSLKQQLKDAQHSTRTETEVVHQLKTIHGKLDAVLQGKRKENTESVELGKALGVIRQMADELRQYRSQAQRSSPQKIANTLANQSVQTEPDPPTAISGPQMSSQGTIVRPDHANNLVKQSSNNQQSKLQENAASNQKNPPDMHRSFRNDDAECEEHSIENTTEQQDNSPPPIAVPAMSNIGSLHAEIGRRGVNKFGKRSHADTFSECSQMSERKKSKKTNLASSKIAIETPSKKACLRSANHSIETTKVDSSQKKVNNDVNGSMDDIHEVPTKGKSSRGPAGV